MSGAGQSFDPICTVDPYERLQLVRNPDGSVRRHFHIPSVPADEHSSQVRTKDVPLDPTRHTWVRIFVPSEAFSPKSNSPKFKRPLVIYFHAGGFVLFSASTSINHDFCTHMAESLDVVVVSVEYRLAPEHRLPAAYDDADEALRWVGTASEAWIRDFADMSNCFLMGCSAGANICYHAGLRAIADRTELAPVRIRGLVLLHAFFGGVRRTGSEVRLVDDLVLAVSVSDLMWELALPVGADRDHEFCNPTAGRYDWEAIGGTGMRVLVVGYREDPLIDRQVAVVEMLKKKGVNAVGEFKEGGLHGLELTDLGEAKLMIDLVKDFIKCT